MSHWTLFFFRFTTYSSRFTNPLTLKFHFLPKSYLKIIGISNSKMEPVASDAIPSSFALSRWGVNRIFIHKNNADFGPYYFILSSSFYVNATYWLIDAILTVSVVPVTVPIKLCFMITAKCVQPSL